MKKRNDAFVCAGCAKEVAPASKTCRNHCPYCFLSLHVDDDMPGDRASSCEGKMIPTSYKRANGAIKILFVCQICAKQHWNKMAADDDMGALEYSIEKWKAVSLGL